MGLPLIKILQISPKAWNWVLYSAKGNQVFASASFKTMEECKEHFESIKGFLSGDYEVQIVYQTGHNSDSEFEFPDFIEGH